jgi:aminoglycoside 6'-N-acetyltransferase
LPRPAGPALLRRLVAADLAEFCAYRGDPEVGRYQGWSPMSPGEALEFIEQMAVAELWIPGTWVQLAIARAGGDALVGDIGLHVRADGLTAEVGVTVAPLAQGGGCGSAAVVAAIGLLFEHTGVSRVLGITDVRNLASARLLERVGMRRAETRQTVFRGEPCTEWVYAAARDGWQPP